MEIQTPMSHPATSRCNKKVTKFRKKIRLCNRKIEKYYSKCPEGTDTPHRRHLDNYYAMFDTHSYHRCGETHFNAGLDIKSLQSLECESRTITMKGLTQLSPLQKNTL